jgi:hypothetical protein
MDLLAELAEQGVLRADSGHVGLTITICSTV